MSTNHRFKKDSSVLGTYITLADNRAGPIVQDELMAVGGLYARMVRAQAAWYVREEDGGEVM